MGCGIHKPNKNNLPFEIERKDYKTKNGRTMSIIMLVPNESEPIQSTNMNNNANQKHIDSKLLRKTSTANFGVNKFEPLQFQDDNHIKINRSTDSRHGSQITFNPGNSVDENVFRNQLMSPFSLHAMHQSNCSKLRDKSAESSLSSIKGGGDNENSLKIKEQNEKDGLGNLTELHVGPKRKDSQIPQLTLIQEQKIIKLKNKCIPKIKGIEPNDNNKAVTTPNPNFNNYGQIDELAKTENSLIMPQQNSQYKQSSAKSIKLSDEKRNPTTITTTTQPNIDPGSQIQLNELLKQLDSQKSPDFKFNTKETQSLSPSMDSIPPNMSARLPSIILGNNNGGKGLDGEIASATKKVNDGKQNKFALIMHSTNPDQKSSPKKVENTESNTFCRIGTFEINKPKNAQEMNLALIRIGYKVNLFDLLKNSNLPKDQSCSIPSAQKLNKKDMNHSTSSSNFMKNETDTINADKSNNEENLQYKEGKVTTRKDNRVIMDTKHLRRNLIHELGNNNNNNNKVASNTITNTTTMIKNELVNTNSDFTDGQATNKNSIKNGNLLQVYPQTKKGTLPPQQQQQQQYQYLQVQNPISNQRPKFKQNLLNIAKETNLKNQFNQAVPLIELSHFQQNTLFDDDGPSPIFNLNYFGCGEFGSPMSKQHSMANVEFSCMTEQDKIIGNLSENISHLDFEKYDLITENEVIEIDEKNKMFSIPTTQGTHNTGGNANYTSNRSSGGSATGKNSSAPQFPPGRLNLFNVNSELSCQSNYNANTPHKTIKVSQFHELKASILPKSKSLDCYQGQFFSENILAMTNQNLLNEKLKDKVDNPDIYNNNRANLPIKSQTMIKQSVLQLRKNLSTQEKPIDTPIKENNQNTLNLLNKKSLQVPELSLLKPSDPNKLSASLNNSDIKNNSNNNIQDLSVLSQLNPSYQRQLSASSVIHTNSVNRTVDEQGKKKINQYIIMKEIGKGGFGKVKLALHAETQVQYAIKVANKKKLQRKMFTRTKSAYTALETEIAIMKKMDHPNIVRLFEVIDDPQDSKLYLVMEYVRKGAVLSKTFWRNEEANQNLTTNNNNNLRDEDTRYKTLSEEKARKYFRALILGLDYMHNYANVIHRDIKPENLLIDENDVLKISDFGISHIMENGSDELHNNAGTKLFLPPEVWQCGKFKGKPTDIWAAGGTLYYFLIGRVPFLGFGVEELRNKICNEELQYPEKLNPKVVNLMKKCLEKDPEKRYTVEEIMKDEWITEDGNKPLENKFGSGFFISDEDMQKAVSKVQFKARIWLSARMKVNLNKTRTKLLKKKSQIIEGNIGANIPD